MCKKNVLNIAELYMIYRHKQSTTILLYYLCLPILKIKDGLIFRHSYNNVQFSFLFPFYLNLLKAGVIFFVVEFINYLTIPKDNKIILDYRDRRVVRHSKYINHLASLMSNIVSDKWSKFELLYTNIFWYVCTQR